MRVLIAEDEQQLSSALAAILKRAGYGVDVVDNGRDALDWAEAGDYDGIVMDIMMPKMDGLEALRRLREKQNTTPILMLTAKSGLSDRVAGLDAGADDYLPKPFEIPEFLARVRALTRRRGAFVPDAMTFQNMTLNRSAFTLSVGEDQLELGRKEFQILEMLMAAHGGVVTVDQMMEKIWGYDSDAENNVVWVYISNLRKKLGTVHAAAEIRAIRGVGYKLEAGT